MPFIFVWLLLACGKPAPGIEIADCQLKRENYPIESIDEKTFKSVYIVKKWKAQLDFVVTNNLTQDIFLAKNYASMQIENKKDGTLIRIEAISHYDPPKKTVRIEPGKSARQSIAVRTEKMPSSAALKVPFSTNEAFQSLIWIESSMVKCLY